jgi:hypothetical protein
MSSCISIATPPAGDELPLSGGGPRGRRGAGRLCHFFQGLHCAVTVVLLALVIWLGVSLRNRRADALWQLKVRARRARRGARRCPRDALPATWPRQPPARCRSARAALMARAPPPPTAPGRAVHAGAAGGGGLYAVRELVPREWLLGGQPRPAAWRWLVRPRRGRHRRLRLRFWRHQRQRQHLRRAPGCVRPWPLRGRCGRHA